MCWLILGPSDHIQIFCQKDGVSFFIWFIYIIYHVVTGSYDFCPTCLSKKTTIYCFHTHWNHVKCFCIYYMLFLISCFIPRSWMTFLCSFVLQLILKKKEAQNRLLAFSNQDWENRPAVFVCGYYVFVVYRIFIQLLVLCMINSLVCNNWLDLLYCLKF